MSGSELVLADQGVDLHSRLPVAVNNMEDLKNLGMILWGSGFFKDVGDARQAIVKVLAGAEVGLGPVASMTAINIIDSKPSFSSNLIASKIKSHPRYNYRINLSTNKACKIEFFELDLSSEKFESIGTFEFNEEMARRAGLLSKNNWKNYPEAMYFSRTISQGARLYCPDIFHSVIPYTTEELAPDVELDASGDVIEGQIKPPRPVASIDPKTLPPSEDEIMKDMEAMVPDMVEKEEDKEPPHPPGKPWINKELSLTENRNVLYGVAIQEWGYASSEAVRETIVEADNWTKNDPPIPDLDTMDEIALYLMEHAPKKP